MKSFQAIRTFCRFSSKGDVHCGKEVLEMDVFESSGFAIGSSVISWTRASTFLELICMYCRQYLASRYMLLHVCFSFRHVQISYRIWLIRNLCTCKCVCKCTRLWLLWTYISNLYHMRPQFWDVYFYLHWQYEFIWTPFNKGTIWSWGGCFKLRKMYLSSQRWKKRPPEGLDTWEWQTTTVSLTFKRHSSQISGTVALWKNEAKAVEPVVPQRNCSSGAPFAVQFCCFVSRVKFKSQQKRMISG